MLGTIVKFSDTLIGKGNKTPALAVTVKKTDGEEKTYNIPKFNEDVIEQFEDLAPGDNVDLVFKKVRGFMNIVEAKKYSGAMDSGSESTAPSTGGAGRTGSRWTPDPNKDRGVALRYAVDAMGEIGDLDESVYLATCYVLANGFLEFITGKITPDTDVPDPEVE